ncbi:DNA polymerase III subunit delta' [Diplocloster hominis]|uniref:DNA polymerase III subunit delta' n=1 Tax=Diplocloster hominis TaxID=3079010 RepID=UPI0031BA4C30
MAGFQDVVGHEQIIDHLQRAIELNKVSHAYLFCAEEGAGKKLLAGIFAQTLQCEKGGVNPCMECHSCIQAAGKNQPDIIWVTHEKPNSIGVEDIRTQVNGDIQVKPYSSPYKIYMIDEAEKMTVQAQNALLKTIEEPPAYGILILLTESADRLLPTILSRCVTLNLKPVADEKIRKYLMEQLQVPDYKADLSLAFAQGNVGRAVKLATSENFNEIKDSALHLLQHIHEMELYEIISALKQITDYRMDINDYLDILMVWYRDVLLFKATKDMNPLIFKEHINYIRQQADKSSYEGIETILEQLDKTKARLKANVNFELAMELLLLTIKEN